MALGATGRSRHELGSSSAIGEIVGAIGVMASLAYLAVQIRTNSADVRDNTTFAVMQMLVEARRDFLNTPLNAVIAKIGAAEKLTIEERILYLGYLQHLANVFDVAHLAMRRRKVDVSLVAGLENRIRGAANAPMFEDFWSRNRHDYSEEFQRFVEPVRAGGA